MRTQTGRRGFLKASVAATMAAPFVFSHEERNLNNYRSARQPDQTKDVIDNHAADN